MLFQKPARRLDVVDQPLFAPSARAVVDLAGAEAARLRNAWVGTEHLALAVLCPGTRGHAFIRSLGVNPDELRARVESKCETGRERSQNLPYTSRAKKVLELAIEEGIKAKVVSLEAEYLLLGLVLEQHGIGAQIFIHDAGITADVVRHAISNPPPETFRVTLSDTADTSLSEQIAQQIAEAIATGLLKPGDRLQTVRSLADQLQIAPGTVARAYAELERRGAIKTDGARGTSVAERAATVLSSRERVSLLSTLMRPAVVQGFHVGATADEFRDALERAIEGIRFEEM